MFHVVLLQYIFNKTINNQFLNKTKISMGSQGQAYKVFSLFACSFIVFLELGLEVAAPHLEAELCPWLASLSDLLSSASSREFIKSLTTSLRSLRVWGLT